MYWYVKAATLTSEWIWKAVIFKSLIKLFYKINCHFLNSWSHGDNIIKVQIKNIIYFNHLKMKNVHQNFLNLCLTNSQNPKIFGLQSHEGKKFTFLLGVKQ